MRIIDVATCLSAVAEVRGTAASSRKMHMLAWEGGRLKAALQRTCMQAACMPTTLMLAVSCPAHQAARDFPSCHVAGLLWAALVSLADCKLYMSGICGHGWRRVHGAMHAGVSHTGMQVIRTHHLARMENEP